MPNNTRFFAISLILVSLVSSCGREPWPTAPPQTTEALPTPNPDVEPMLGDTRIRTADGMLMVYVPGGSLQMGSDDAEIEYALELCSTYSDNCSKGWYLDEQPAHTVVLDSFWLDQTEVSNAQYQSCLESGVCELPECADDPVCATPGCGQKGEFGGDNKPVVCVNWYQAQVYCAWMGGRLPTEAEWEYAVRGRAGARYPWGYEFDGRLLNYCDVRCDGSQADTTMDDGYPFTSPVGSYPEGVSWCGALDMAGNVWEWVTDRYAPYDEKAQINPTGSAEGDWRGARGGSWLHSPLGARGADRGYGAPDLGSTVTGFRCVVPVLPER